MSRGSWANRNEWDDKNPYFFGINASYFRNGSSAVYIPVLGSASESSDPSDIDVQFIPDGSGRLVSLTIYSTNAVAPDVTTIKLNQIGVGELGLKNVTLLSQTVQTFTFKDELTSGTFEWDINDGTSIGISVEPDSAPDDVNAFILFEIYR